MTDDATETFDSLLRAALIERDEQVAAGTYKPPVYPTLTLDDIREIRRADAAGELTWRGNGERFGIDFNIVDHIVNSSTDECAFEYYEIFYMKTKPVPNPGGLLKMLVKKEGF